MLWKRLLLILFSAGAHKLVLLRLKKENLASKKQIAESENQNSTFIFVCCFN